MSGGLLDALEDYARRLATDSADAMPHVVFLVAVNGTDAPRLAACGRDGRVYEFEHITTSPVGSREDSTAAWTFGDLEDGSEMLADFTRVATRRYHRMTPPAAVIEATTVRQWRLDREMRDAMEKAAYIEAHPFACVCGERWKSERGFKQHQRACLHVKPGVTP